MTVTTARYDGLAAWYEDFRPALPLDEEDALERLLGPGRGRCLDFGCGTGVALEPLQRLGWSVEGTDVSQDLLEIARGRGLHCVLAPAEALPFADGSFDAAVSIWTHTDVDDFPVVLQELARVLRPSAPFVYIGAHPCFVGPHSRRAGPRSHRRVSARESARHTCRSAVSCSRSSTAASPSSASRS
jgi:ubiquinone/menaquinone biosynthesis C-methylase UbiE